MRVMVERLVDDALGGHDREINDLLPALFDDLRGLAPKLFP